MKKYIKIYIFIVSLFFSINIVKADYEAAVLNPAGAKCDLVSKSTGYCFYANKKLNSVNGLKYLDTGDVVKVLTSYDKIKSKNTKLCSSNYVYVSQFYSRNGKTYYGYYCEEYLTTGEVPNDVKEEFQSAGFPESYWSKLYVMKKAHPSWQFKAIDTGLTFDAALEGETNRLGMSLVQLSASNNYAYLSTSSYSFDYYKDKFIPRDDTDSDNAWYDANEETVAYYLDPRNFLSDMYVFQFEGLSYDSEVSTEKYTTLVTSILGNAYISKFASDFVAAGPESGVSPIYLAALSRQEVGGGTSPSTAVAGKYNGMYNFYNIGASGGASPAIKGLKTAAKTDPSTLRPWNTEHKAIVGGAIWIGDKYISIGQDTIYFKKWNVIYNYLKSKGKKPTYSNFNHQYMTSIMAPTTEATTSYRSYSQNNMMDTAFVFHIPVYSNMPEETLLPTKGGWPNNYLKSITINDKKVAEFDGEVEVYNYNLDINNPTIKLEAAPVSTTATITGLGSFEITENTTKEIKVKAQNGNIKTYKINIILTGELIEPPVDVQTTLNNAGVKNGDNYITGIKVGSDISTIKTKITNANSEAIVVLLNSSDKEKNSGKIATGDKVKVTVGEETKTYQIVIYGDVNGDSYIDALDYVKIRKYIMNTANISGCYKEAADANKDGNIDALDYVKIKKYIMGTAQINQ